MGFQSSVIFPFRDHNASRILENETLKNIFEYAMPDILANRACLGYNVKMFLVIDCSSFCEGGHSTEFGAAVVDSTLTLYPVGCLD